MIGARSLFLVEITVIIRWFQFSFLSLFVPYNYMHNCARSKINSSLRYNWIFCMYNDVYESNLQKKDSIANDDTYDD